MKTIWKYSLDDKRRKFDIPIGAEILSVASQNDIPCLWINVDTEAKTEKRTFELYGTGWDLQKQDNKKYLGSVMIQNEMLVFHVFEILK